MRYFDAMKTFGKTTWFVFVFLCFSFTAFGQANDADEDYIVPVRPSVSESGNIQKKGVLQIEYGADFDFRSPEFRNAQTSALGVYYAATKRLRLDFEFEPVVSEKDLTFRRATGIGDVSLGFKAVVRDEPEKKLAVAFSYSIKLPTADADKNLGTGKIDHNLRLIFDRSIGKNDYTVNVSYLNVGRENENKRDSGAQVIFRYDRKINDKFEIINELFGNTVDEDLPRGIYFQDALAYKINKRLQIDIGIRPGFGRDAPRIGILGGIVVGIGKLYR